MTCDEFAAEGGTERHQLELALTQRFEVEMGRPGGRWKAESQGFPTSTIRASEDITCTSYEGFEIVIESINRAAFGGNPLNSEK